MLSMAASFISSPSAGSFCSFADGLLFLLEKLAFYNDILQVGRPRHHPHGTITASVPVVGRGHASLLTILDTWHSKTVRGIGRLLRHLHVVRGQRSPAAVDLGFGRIVVSEIETPNVFVNLV